MEVKPGYKQTEAGTIPTDWDLDFIENIAQITTGSKNTQDRVEDGLYPFFVRSQKVERINSYSYNGEAVLTAGDGVGTGKVFHYIKGKFDVHQRVYQISEFTERINGYFFFLYFSNNFYNRIMQMTAKSSVDSVRREMIAKMLVLLPPGGEQEAIAEALSDADALLESLEQLIAKKRQVKQGAMQELLTGKRRLPGFTKIIGFKTTEIGVIPEDWSTVKIGEVSRIFGRIGFRGYTINDIVDEGKGAISISPSNIKEGRTDFANCTFISWDKYEESPEIKIFNGDILLVKTGSTVGKTAIVQNLPGKATLNPQLVVLKKVKINRAFLGYMMSFNTIQNQITNTVVGGALPTLSQSQVAQFLLPLPPTLSEQEAIASILLDMDSEIVALERKREKIRQIKQGMMQELLTGRTRLI